MKLAIASGKGGTGKTTLSTNLAHLISQNQKVVLSDLDVEEPNSGLFISGKTVNSELQYKNIPTWNSEACTLCGKCADVCAFNAVIKTPSKIMTFPELCHSCHACTELCPENALHMQPKEMGALTHIENDNLSFVESRLNIGEEQAVPLIAQTLDYIDEKFPGDILKIVDSPPGTSCPMIEAVKDADYVFLITEPTPFGLHDLKLAVETVRLLERDFSIIINRYGTGNDDVIDYCRDEYIEITAKLPDSRKAAEIYSDGGMIYQNVPEFKTELQKAADFMIARMEACK